MTSLMFFGLHAIDIEMVFFYSLKERCSKQPCLHNVVYIDRATVCFENERPSSIFTGLSNHIVFLVLYQSPENGYIEICSLNLAFLPHIF